MAREARGVPAPGRPSARGRFSFGPPGSTSSCPRARTLRRAARLVRGRPPGPLAGAVCRDGRAGSGAGAPRCAPRLSEVDQLPPASSGLSRWLARRLPRSTSRLPVAVPLEEVAQRSEGRGPRFTARAASTRLGLRCRRDHAKPLLDFFQPHLQFAFSGLLRGSHSCLR